MGLLVLAAPDDGDSCDNDQNGTEGPELDEVLKSHVYLGRSTSKAMGSFDEKILNIISQQGNLQI